MSGDLTPHRKSDGLDAGGREIVGSGKRSEAREVRASARFSPQDIFHITCHTFLLHVQVTSTSLSFARIPRRGVLDDIYK